MRGPSDAFGSCHAGFAFVIMINLVNWSFTSSAVPMRLKLRHFFNGYRSVDYHTYV